MTPQPSHLLVIALLPFRLAPLRKRAWATFREAEEMAMLNASRCRRVAAEYARRADEAGDIEERRALRRLEFLWRDMAPLAESFDRWSDPRSKERLYEMLDAAAEVRRKVA
jgi:hypothetical protein